MKPLFKEITLKQLKQHIFEIEKEFRMECIEDDNTNGPRTWSKQEIKEEINELKSDIMSCKSIDELVNWYEQAGFKTWEAYENIINLVIKK